MEGVILALSVLKTFEVEKVPTSLLLISRRRENYFA